MFISHSIEANKGDFSWDISNSLLSELIKQDFSNGSNTYWVWYSPNLDINSILIYPDCLLFPATIGEFETFQFSIPAKPELCLQLSYGKDWNKFPRPGILHHSSANGESETDIDILKNKRKELLDILNLLNVSS